MQPTVGSLWFFFISESAVMEWLEPLGYEVESL